MITLASVGYGDISPITPMGRVMTVILALLGIGIFAIPAGLLASAFTDQLRLDREAFRSDLVAAIEQGVFDPLRNPRLAERAARLHLSSADVKRIADQASREVADRQTALERSGAPLLLDPFRQPDLAISQAELLLLQVEAIAQVPTVRQRILERLNQQSGDASASKRLRQILEAAPGESKQG